MDCDFVTEHIFRFSCDFRDGKRVCGECRQTYNQGNHQHVAVLKPYTSYVCPLNDDGQPHSSTWSGSQDHPELRQPTDDRCICGAQFIEEDTEVWRLTFDMLDSETGKWRSVKRDGTKHSTHKQRDGLLTIPDEIRNVQLRKIGE